MAAWGEIAVGEVRRSASYPSRSAILGLISAALGIRRDETEKLSALFSGYDVAIKVQSVGTLLKDYHTVQVPDSVGKVKYATRRDEIVIGKERLGTILTSREYRCDSLSIVALRPRKVAPYTLEEIQSKLINPEFVLYLGRKSCPLSAPLKPQIVKENGFRSALDRATFPPLITSYSGEDVTERFIPISAARYYWENNAGDMDPQQTLERYDEPLNKSRWQFAPRKEHLFVERSK
jgi:CRISPR system Cascade subunit CasD